MNSPPGPSPPQDYSPLSAGLRLQELKIFLSSGDDALEARDCIEGLVNRVFNPQLRRTNVPFRFAVERWEHEAAQRNRPGESTNDRFVKKAREADMTIALLLERLGTGTREELQAVLDETNHQIKPLWFVAPHSHPESDVATFLEENADILLHEKLGEIGSTVCWEGIVKVLLSRTLDAIYSAEEVYRERR
jgi:hypothetical protein